MHADLMQLVLATAATDITVDPVSQATGLAEALERGGIVFTLSMVIMGVAWLFVQERKKNEKLNGELMKNNRDMVEALLSVKMAVDGFRETIATLKTYICEPKGRGR